MTCASPGYHSTLLVFALGFLMAAIRFLAFNPASQRWFLAGADSWDLHAWVADGDFAGEKLVFSDARRLGGGVTLTEFRYRFEQPTAAAFDFLIGEWDTSHDMTFPNGQRAQWAANGTGVYALNGAAVMEFNWFDVDPNLPDAATTILRLYNRGIRRWENLYVPNRSHTVLYFGGVQERDAIVLHPFEAGASGSMSRWVFHGIEKDAYHWYGEISTDRGETWAKTWLIDAERKAVEPAGDG